MTGEGTTIAELAEELEVTKRTIRYHLQQIGGGQTKNQSGMIIITPEEKRSLMLRIKGDEIQETITNEIEGKNERIKKLHEAVNYLSKLLDEEKNKNQLLEASVQGHLNIIQEKDKQLQDFSNQVDFLQDQLSIQTQLLNQEQQLHFHTKKELDGAKEAHLLLETKLEEKENQSWLSRLFSRQ